jgi:protoporphyrin/coproporphyrin ferrochelatase
MSQKTGILLLNLGGPDSLKAVKPFLYNLFSDPEIFDIMEVPFAKMLQKPLAWVITTFRGHKTTEYYRLMGGRSPILPLTQAQGEALKAHLKDQHGHEMNVYIAMRYWHPFTEDAVDQIIRDGIEHLIVLPLYPQYSLTTTGSSMNELNRVLSERGVKLKISLIEHYYSHPEYLDAVGSTIRSALTDNTWSCPDNEVTLLFSAHSLPKRFVEKTGDVYPRHIDETVELIMQQHFPNNPWKISYQSRLGSIPWLEPYTDDALRDFAQEGRHNILMVPISFVSDHIETLYEIDLLYLPLARELAIQNCHRVASLNTHPLFIKALGSLVADRVPQCTPV